MMGVHPIQESTGFKSRIPPIAAMTPMMMEVTNSPVNWLLALSGFPSPRGRPIRALEPVPIM